ncbi:MAG: GGDEF domain-containing protein [Pseudomonadota bacterium]
MANRIADDTQHWKAKHRELLREFDKHENSWRDLEKVLRRLVTRLCIAASGHDPRLDTELTQVSSAVKREAGAPDLELLLTSLSSAMMGPDARGVAKGAAKASLELTQPLVAEPATTPAASAESSHSAIVTALGSLLQRLIPADAPETEAAALLGQLSNASSDATLARVIERAADLVRDRADQFARERMSAAALLTDVTNRLNELAQIIASGDSDLNASRLAGESMQTQVLSNVQQLSDEAMVATEIAPLRQLVAARVQNISREVHEYREREDSRFKAHAARNEHLTRQVSELKLKTRSLESDLEVERRRARIDALTGIANRAAFDERVREEIARVARTDRPISLLYWDLDHFKSINDKFGHAAGDRVLQEVANCFSSRLRSSDFLGRMGGEEFVIMLMDTPTSGAIKLADDLRQAVASLKMHFRGEPVPVTVSCGVTGINGGDTAEAAMERADKALYQAKDSGRNNCIAA